MQLDLRILELLASKICHDLISPVGAINNGVELIEDIGPSVTEDAMKLISNSAQQAAKRLKLFRVTYGRAGAEGITLRDARKTAHDYLSHGKMELKWDESLDLYPFAEKPGALKLLLCCLMMSEDVLSHGGTITVDAIAGGNHITITATGSHATMADAIKQALEGSIAIEEVVPRNVHAFVTHAFCSHYGLSVVPRQSGDDTLALTLSARNPLDTPAQI